MSRILRVFPVWLVVWPLVMAGLAPLLSVGPDRPLVMRTSVPNSVLGPVISPVVAF